MGTIDLFFFDFAILTLALLIGAISIVSAVTESLSGDFSDLFVLECLSGNGLSTDLSTDFLLYFLSVDLLGAGDWESFLESRFCKAAYMM